MQIPGLTKEDESVHNEIIQTTESEFRDALNADSMETEKLAEGVRGFASDAAKLNWLVHA